MTSSPSLPNPVERIAFEACLVSARHCNDAIISCDEIGLIRYEAAMRSAVQGLAKTLPSHSRMRRTAIDLFDKLKGVTKQYYSPGMATVPPAMPKLITELELNSKEYKALVRAIERAEELRSSYAK